MWLGRATKKINFSDYLHILFLAYNILICEAICFLNSQFAQNGPKPTINPFFQFAIGKEICESCDGDSSFPFTENYCHIFCLSFWFSICFIIIPNINCVIIKSFLIISPFTSYHYWRHVERFWKRVSWCFGTDVPGSRNVAVFYVPCNYD